MPSPGGTRCPTVAWYPSEALLLGEVDGTMGEGFLRV